MSNNCNSQWWSHWLSRSQLQSSVNSSFPPRSHKWSIIIWTRVRLATISKKHTYSVRPDLGVELGAESQDVLLMLRWFVIKVIFTINYTLWLSVGLCLNNNSTSCPGPCYFYKGKVVYLCHCSLPHHSQH